MKKLLTLLCVLLLLCAPLTAYADLLALPEEAPKPDAFYKKHADECTPVNATYIANGPEGYVLFYKNPESDKLTYSMTNDRNLVVEYTYSDGAVTWGLAKKGGGGYRGWVDMACLVKYYDKEAFWAEHEDEFVKYTPARTVDLSEYGEEIALYFRYPGDESNDMIALADISEPISLLLCWTDETGLEWGLWDRGDTPGPYGDHMAWICLSDPANLELVKQIDYNIIPAADYGDIPQPGDKVDNPRGADGGRPENAGIESEGSNWLIWLAVGMVAAVVIVTVILIAVLFKRKK